jgi:hypothetical protein
LTPAARPIKIITAASSTSQASTITISLAHFQQLREDPRLRGLQGAVRFAYDDVPSYLDNTMFARLVKTGLAGTSGNATELVHRQVVESFNGNKALVLAALFGENLPQSNATPKSATCNDPRSYFLYGSRC